jgi:hypothetical protein
MPTGTKRLVWVHYRRTDPTTGATDDRCMGLYVRVGYLPAKERKAAAEGHARLQAEQNRMRMLRAWGDTTGVYEITKVGGKPPCPR